jgi:hypothetical protein
LQKNIPVCPSPTFFPISCKPLHHTCEFIEWLARVSALCMLCCRKLPPLVNELCSFIFPVFEHSSFLACLLFFSGFVACQSS